MNTYYNVIRDRCVWIRFSEQTLDVTDGIGMLTRIELL